MIVIPNITLLMKIPTLQLQDSKLDKVYELLKGTAFAATDVIDAKILKSNSMQMNRIARVLNYAISFMSVFWVGSFYFKRYFDRTEVVHSYVPFRTDTWANYTISVLLECGPILWIGFGHISLDILVATFYAQAQTQLKMIKHQLTQLYNEEGENKLSTFNFQYKDFTDGTVFQRLVQVVNRFERLVWYKNEIDSIFNYSLSFQFLAATSGVCLVIYRMTVVSVTSFPFIFLALLFCVLLTQVFLYCYFGNLVEFESRSINDSLYLSDWASLSPSFRRLLLVAMTRWSQPIRPQVCGIIPLSLTTFVQILKSSYTLYTVLEAAK
uniref:Odorant receptor n=1 Tax=Semiothisa cinerearia TaxID=2249628 RepID=A0A889XLD3_9NEOP|nr:odorant receptor [Semiothisa cinerearia]